MIQTIRLEIAAPLAEIILDQPQRRNALSLEMWAALPARLAEANADPAVKVLLLHGGGTGVFAAGADISEFPAIYGTEADARHSGQTIARALAALEDSPKPVIAAIEGPCIGGGVSLAVACDLRIATTSATFGITPARLGLVYPPEIHRIVAAPDYLPDEAERVVDSSKVGGRSGKGAVRQMLEPLPPSLA